MTNVAPELARRWRDRPSTDLPRILIMVPVAILVVALATTFVGTQDVTTTKELVLPLAGLAAITLAAVGCYRFEWFVLAVLAVRTLVDVSKIKPATNAVAVTGTAPSAGSSGTAASALAILFIAMAVLWLLAQHKAGKAQSVSFIDAAFVFFVGTCALSVVGSVNRTASLTEVARVVAAVMMFIVVERLLTSVERIRRVLVACFVAAVPPILLGGLQAVTGRGRFVTAGVSRVLGTFLHPNTFGFFLSMFILMAIALYPHCEQRVQLGLIGMIVVCGAMLLLTYSRGAWVACVLGLLLIGLLQSRRIFVMLIAGGIVTVAAVPSVLSRISNLGSGTTVTGSSGNSLSWRFGYWSEVLGLNHNNPITGIGLKGTKYLTDQSKAPHNDYLRAYAETGVLGLLGFLLVLLAFIAVARRALRQARPGIERGIAVGFAAVLVAYLIDSFGDNLMSEVVVLWYFYTFAACALAVARLGTPPPPKLPPAPKVAEEREAKRVRAAHTRRRRVAIA
ncbi:MAG TPA: O-antigen ligase family protein [Jatrophihabitantaceae bacterium]|nr:O-antigen ligase family protein [Jatrophihabitantaceae bacterium]